jgi:microcompartment protein CcmK/EutM
MVLARVKGTVVATHKSPPMEGLKLLLLEKIDPVTLRGKGDYVVGIDSVGANAGEIVFYVTGSSARMTDTTKGKPSDATIIAIVDAIEKDGSLTYDKAASVQRLDRGATGESAGGAAHKSAQGSPQ